MSNFREFLAGKEDKEAYFNKMLEKYGVDSSGNPTKSMDSFKGYLPENESQINESDDIKMASAKGKKLVISNGFKSRSFSDDKIIAIAMLTPIGQVGRVINPINKALEIAGAGTYVNKQQAGTPTVFVDKDKAGVEAIKQVLNVDVSGWL